MVHLRQQLVATSLLGAAVVAAGIYTAKTMYERREILFAVQPTLEHHKKERDLFRGKGNAERI